MKKNLAVLVLSIVTALVLGEALVRVADVPMVRDEARTFLLSTAPLRDPDGVFRYPPHRAIRHGIVTPHGLEVDLRYRTNNLGLIDHRDYAPESAAPRSIFFLGDSYAAGVEGGEPWIPRLRDETGVALYNLGIPATGCQHFRTMFARMSKRLPPPTEVVIVAISNDFLRREWFPDVGRDTVWLCDEGEDQASCRTRPPYAYLIAPNLDAAGMLRRAAEIREHDPVEDEPFSIRRALRRSKLLLLTKRVIDRTLTGKGTARGETFRRNLAALGEIRRLAGAVPMRFFHVPDRNEARAARYDFDIAGVISSLGIEYVPALTRCGMTSDVYFPNDNHPNTAGYHRLSDCVSRHLHLQERPEGGP